MESPYRQSVPVLDIIPLLGCVADGPKRSDFAPRREPDHDLSCTGATVLTKRRRTKGKGNETRSFCTAYAPAVLTLRGRFAWAHGFNPDRSIAATFQTLPGASFIVSGAAQARDAALTSAAVEMKWANGWSTAATFDGEFSGVTRSYSGKGVIRYAW